MTTLAPARIEPPSRISEATPRPPPTLEAVKFDFPDRWSGHPGIGLTAARIVQIYRAAEFGYPQAQCDLFDDVLERDGHLRAQDNMVIDGVAGKPWIIQAGGDDPASLDAAAALEQALQRVPNMRETLEHLLTSRAYGWSASEILWDRTSDGTFAPVWFLNVPHRRFIFDLLGQPRILVAPSYDGVELTPGRWLFSRRRHRSIACSGLMRTATWWSLFKSLSVRDWVLFCERFGLPTPIGTYDDSTPDKEKDALVQTVQNIGRDAYGVFHRSCDIKSVDVKVTGTPNDVQGPLVELANAEISKLWTGATLTSGEGTSAGSYALGAVHENNLFRVLVGESERLAELFAQQLGAPFAAWNGFKGAMPPRLICQVSQHMDAAQWLQIFSTAANELGVDIDADQLRTSCGLKKPTGDVFRGTKTPGGSAPPAGDTPADGAPTGGQEPAGAGS